MHMNKVSIRWRSIWRYDWSWTITL